MQVIREPVPAVVCDFLRTELGRLSESHGRLVQVVANCTIQYQGRARSMLSGGERLLLFKPDGTFLVHTAKKAKPVNWQPPGAIFDTTLEGDTVKLTAYRRRPEEMVQVTFHETRLLVSVPLRDSEELALVGSEDDLQQLLFERPELVEPGFQPRRRERQSRRGNYDLDGDDADGKRVVVEVKRTTAGVKEAQQLWRYVEPLRNQKEAVRGILIAPRIAEKARGLLADHQLEWKELDWNDALPKVEAMRRSGQASLGGFDGMD